MFDSFSVKKPIYPVAAFFCSIIVLVFGMIFSKSIYSFVLVGALFVVYSAFGMFRGLWKMTGAMLLAGLIIGGLAFLTNRNLNAFWQTLDRMLLLGMCAVPMVTVSPARLTRCMTQLHFPRAVTLGMLVTLRFVPVMVTEIKKIREAVRVRSIGTKKKGFSYLYRAFFLPLLFRIIGISDTLSLSLETRAFTLSNEPSTVYDPVKIKARDLLFLFFVFAAIAFSGVLIWRR